jgi:apolipoprotein N-acyltransferase
MFFIIGALLMLSFAPMGWYGLGFALLLPLLLVCLVAKPKEAAWHGFWFGSGLFLAGTYWLYVSVHVFGEAPLWIAIFLMLGLVVIMGLYYALAAWLICHLSDARPLRLVVAAPAAWTAVEWIRGWFLSGFPWMTMGYSQIDSPLSGFAPLLGVFGISAVLVLSAAATVALLHGAGRHVLMLVLLTVLPWTVGYGLQGKVWTEPAGAPVLATIVQGGVSQDRKWLREQFQPTLELYAKSLAANPDSDIIVWPEVAIPAALDQVPDFLQQLETHIVESNQTLLLGILERDLNTGAIYNSVLILGGPERQTYRKRHLVPFGEMFPVPDFVREWLRIMSLPHSDMTAGNAQQPLLLAANGHKLAVAICYEDAYGAEQLYALREASILINVSNDAWFGDTIAPHQHLEIARMRALEAGRYVIRATNNGVSAFIGPQGDLLESGPQFRFASMSRNITPLIGLTPYASLGNWPVIIIVLSALGWCMWRRAVNR